jgi:hypothetical protein
VETEQFLKESRTLLTESERLDLISYVASNPDAGEIMAETGGVRKLRWGAKGRGKRGGARVIYYYRNELMPLILLDFYAKSVKANLSRAERNAIRQRIPRLVETYLRKRPQ